MSRLARLIALLCGVTCPTLPAQQLPMPTIANGAYAPGGAFDFWSARSSAPAPLIIQIHGGGFTGGDKSRIPASLLAAAKTQGFAVMAIDYPFLQTHPIQAILPFTARAVQYARAHAAEWRIDPARIACLGDSAGAGASLWIAVHPDLADPAATDPVARQSSRIQAAALINGQATYDLLRWKELLQLPTDPAWQTDPDEDIHFFHFPTRAAALSAQGVAIRRDVDMYGLIAPGAPPLFLYSDFPTGKPRDRNEYLHSPRHEQIIADRYQQLGLPFELLIGPAACQQDAYPAAVAFFARALKR